MKKIYIILIYFLFIKLKILPHVPVISKFSLKRNEH